MGLTFRREKSGNMEQDRARSREGRLGGLAGVKARESYAETREETTCSILLVCTVEQNTVGLLRCRAS